jgi:hypothetical protein
LGLASGLLWTITMRSMVRPFAVLATAFFIVPAAAPAFAQPGPDMPPPAEVTGASPPVPAGTVVIVSPQPPIVTQPAGQPAGPGQVMPATPPPQNEDWNNVSHINGYPVKVGERGDYLYDNGKTINVATNPVGWMFGFYGISVSRAVHANVAIRGDLNMFDIDDRSGHEFGVSVPIYFRRVFQGPFLEVGLVDRNMGDSCFECGDSGKDTIGPEVMFGWQWMFDSGLNVAMAFGGLKNLNGDSMSSSDTEPAGYFRIGYAF